MLKDEIQRGDTVVFNTESGNHEGRVVKVYGNSVIKVRYRVLGVVPVYRIDYMWRMLAHVKKEEE